MSARLVTSLLCLLPVHAAMTEPQYPPHHSRALHFYPTTGNLLISVAWGGEVSVWNVSNPDRYIRVCTVYSDTMNVLPSAKAEGFYSAGRDGYLRLWNLSCAQQQAGAVRVSDWALTALASSSTGQLYLGDEIGDIFQVDLKTHTVTRFTIPYAPAPTLPDVLVGSYLGWAAYISKDKLGGRPGPRFRMVSSLLETSTGDLFAGTQDGRVWRCALAPTFFCKELAYHPWPTGTNAVFGYGALVTSSPSIDLIATSGHDGTVRLWDRHGTLRGELNSRVRGLCSEQVKPLSSMSITPDGRTLITASSDDCVLFWNLATQVPQQLGLAETPSGSTLAVHPAGAFVAVSSSSGLAFWELDYAPQTPEIGPVKLGFPGIAFSRAGERFAMADGSRVSTFSSRGEHVCSSAPTRKPSQDDVFAQVAVIGAHTFVLTLDHELRVFGPDCQLLKMSQIPGAVKGRVPFTTLGNQALMGVGQKILIADSSLSVDPLLEHNAVITALATVASGIVVGDAAGRITIYGRDVKKLSSGQAHREPVALIASSGNGLSFATATATGELRMWDHNGKARWDAVRGPQRYLTSVSVDPDGLNVLTTNVDDGLFLWGSAGTLKRRLAVGGFSITAATFSPVASQFVTASIEGSFRIWAPPGPRRGKTLGLGGRLLPSVSKISVDASSGRVLTLDRSGHAQVWDPIGRTGAEARRLPFSPSEVIFSEDISVLAVPSGAFLIPSAGGAVFADLGGTLIRSVRDRVEACMWMIVNASHMGGEVLQQESSEQRQPPSARWVLKKVTLPPNPAPPSVGTNVEELSFSYGPTAVAALPKGGVLIGSTDGSLHEFHRGHFIPLGKPTRHAIRELIVDNDGEQALIADEGGNLIVWSLQQAAPLRAVATGLRSISKMTAADKGRLILFSALTVQSEGVEAWSYEHLKPLWRFAPGLSIGSIQEVRSSIWLGLHDRIVMLTPSGKRLGQLGFLGKDQMVAVSGDGRFWTTVPDFQQAVAITNSQGTELPPSVAFRKYDAKLDLLESTFRRLWRIGWQQYVIPAWSGYRGQSSMLQITEALTLSWVLLWIFSPALLARLMMSKTDGSSSFLDIFARFKFLDAPFEVLCANRRCRTAYLNSARRTIIGREIAPPRVFVDLGDESDLKRIAGQIKARRTTHIWFHAPGGLGKTTLARHLTQLVATDSDIVPIFIEHDWLLTTQNADYSSFLEDIALRLRFGPWCPPTNMVRHWLHDGDVALFVDGISEMSVRSTRGFFQGLIKTFTVKTLVITSRDEAAELATFEVIAPRTLNGDTIPPFCSAYLGADRQDTLAEMTDFLREYLARFPVTPLFARILIESASVSTPSLSRSPVAVVRDYVAGLCTQTGMRKEDFYWAAQVCSAVVIDWNSFTPLVVRRDEVVGALKASANATYFRRGNHVQLEPTAVLEELVEAGLLVAPALGQIRFREDPVAEYLAAFWLSVQEKTSVEERVSRISERYPERADHLRSILRELGKHLSDAKTLVVDCS